MRRVVTVGGTALAFLSLCGVSAGLVKRLNDAGNDHYDGSGWYISRAFAISFVVSAAAVVIVLRTDRTRRRLVPAGSNTGTLLYGTAAVLSTIQVFTWIEIAFFLLANGAGPGTSRAVLGVGAFGVAVVAWWVVAGSLRFLVRRWHEVPLSFDRGEPAPSEHLRESDNDS